MAEYVEERSDYAMTKDEIKARLEAAEKEIADLKAKLNKASEIPDYPEFDYRDIVWYMNDDLKVDDYINRISSDLKSSYHKFHTKEYAKEFADICHKIAMLLHCKWYVDRDYVPNFNSAKELRYFLYFDSKEDKYDVTYVVHTFIKYPMVFFSNKDAAQKAADWMNERHKQERSD